MLGRQLVWSKWPFSLYWDSGKVITCGSNLQPNLLPPLLQYLYLVFLNIKNTGSWLIILHKGVIKLPRVANGVMLEAPRTNQF